MDSARIRSVDALTPYIKDFFLSQQTLLTIKDKLNRSFDAGLSDDEKVNQTSSLKMLLTYLHDIPNDSQTGYFYAIDLGGTNLRFFQVQLSKNQPPSFSSTSYAVPPEFMTGTKDQLFDFMAQKLYDGVTCYQDATEPIKFVGFTFSFPVKQHSLCHGTLVTWTKGFDIDGVVDQDVSDIFAKSIQKLGLNVENLVLINDTTGTLLSGATTNTNTTIGVINGTGSNACYIEKTENVPKWKSFSEVDPREILINTEWGAFGDLGDLDFIKTKYDIAVDQSSLRPGFQTYEKMMSGLYLGEIARLVIVDLVKDGLLFNGKLPESLKNTGSLDTKFLSAAYNLVEMRHLFNNHLNIDIVKNDANLMSCLFDAIIYRSACLIGVGLSTLVDRCEKKTPVVAADGSLFRFVPTYINYCLGIMKKVVKNINFSFILADDGSGKGAALAAAVASCAKRPLKIN